MSITAERSATPAMTTRHPQNADDLAAIIADANASGRGVEARGGGSKARLGGWTSPAEIIDMAAFTGIVDYDPAAQVITARAGTPLTQIEAVLAEKGQMLAFEPMDHALILGGARGQATLGGLTGANSSGPRRLSAGALRDHLLGFQAVTGRGEAFKTGDKTGKGETGFDLAKLMAGSWGSLAVFTELTFKVLPAPRESASLILKELDDDRAVAAMGAALGAPADISGAAHLPRHGDRGAFTLLRLEGSGPSVAARVDVLREALSDFGFAEVLPTAQSSALWASVRDAEMMAGDGPLWRVTLPPARAGEFIDMVAANSETWMLDWAGGLIWLAGPAEMGVRNAAVALGGQAVLVRPGDAPDVPAFPPDPPALTALAQRVKAAFDPNRILADRRHP